MAKDRPFMCGACHKKFTTEDGARAHASHHKRAAIEIYQRIGEPVRTSEEHESMASLFVQGEINRAMGVSNPSWLEEMLP